MKNKYEIEAMRILGKITSVEERKDAFIFANDEIKQDGCIVIIKDTFEVLSMSEYVMKKV